MPEGFRVNGTGRQAVPLSLDLLGGLLVLAGSDLRG